MATIKTYTDLEQSKKLVKILPIESADMLYYCNESNNTLISQHPFTRTFKETDTFSYVHCWSLAALIEELNRNCWKVSLKCCGAEWNITYDDGERYISASADYAIDACYEMILKLHKLKML